MKGDWYIDILKYSTVKQIKILPSWHGGCVAISQTEADVDSDDLQGHQEVEGQMQIIPIWINIQK